MVVALALNVLSKIDATQTFSNEFVISKLSFPAGASLIVPAVIS